jgi:hypothetical protein
MLLKLSSIQGCVSKDAYPRMRRCGGAERAVGLHFPAAASATQSIASAGALAGGVSRARDGLSAGVPTDMPRVTPARTRTAHPVLWANADHTTQELRVGQCAMSALRPGG